MVQKIAGIACREVAGLHSMGTGSARAFGAIRERIPGSSGPNVAQGVGVEVGETQAAVDLDIVVDYGASIAELGQPDLPVRVDLDTGVGRVGWYECRGQTGGM